MPTKVGILGATGIIGQNYINLLENHPWFEVVALAASANSKTYIEALQVSKRAWKASGQIPEKIRGMPVFDSKSGLEAMLNQCDFVFSALDTAPAVEIEPLYAKHIPVVSNAAAYRKDPLVAMIIPEINDDHLEVIGLQKRIKGFAGFIVVKPNCSIQSYLAPLHALLEQKYDIDKVIVTTMQAVSGAGYPGVPSLDVIDNMIPFIAGEEEKTEHEPYKILGTLTEKGIVPYEGMKISATCTRVPVRDGHSAIVNFSLRGKKPTPEEIIRIWREFRGTPQSYNLPSAPKEPIIYLDESDRPQPLLDRDNGHGMAVTIGRLRQCEVLDYKFACLSHNTKRGAAGGAILTAELLVREGYI